MTTITFEDNPVRPNCHNSSLVWVYISDQQIMKDFLMYFPHTDHSFRGMWTKKPFSM